MNTKLALTTQHQTVNAYFRSSFAPRGVCIMSDLRLATDNGAYRLCYMMHLVLGHYSITVTGSYALTGVSCGFNAKITNRPFIAIPNPCTISAKFSKLHTCSTPCHLQPSILRLLLAAACCTVKLASLHFLTGLCRQI